MAEYVGQDKLLHIFSLDRWGKYDPGEVRTLIMSVKPEDVQPVVRGKWTNKHDDVCYWFECSVCGQRPPWNEWGTEWQSPFCPNCGADMRECET